MAARSVTPMNGAIARWRRTSSGSALVEAAIALPVLIFLLFGVMDFGRAFYAALSVTNGVRAGLSYGTRSPAKSSDFTGIQNAATAAASDVSGFNAVATRYCRCWDGIAESVMATCSSACISHTIRIYVQVTGTATFTPITHYVGIPAAFTITRVGKMRAQ